MDPGTRCSSPSRPTTPGRQRSRGCARRPSSAGLDPNVWFHNVERIVAKRIGRETVQYVSNIYKYYVAYKLLEDERRGTGTGQGAEARG